MGWRSLRHIAMKYVSTNSAILVDESVKVLKHIFGTLANLDKKARDFSLGVDLEELALSGHAEIAKATMVELALVKHAFRHGHGFSTGFGPAALQAKAIEHKGNSIFCSCE